MREGRKIGWQPGRERGGVRKKQGKRGKLCIAGNVSERLF